METRFYSLIIRFGCLLLALLMLAGCTGDKSGDSSSKGDSSSAITSSNAETAIDAMRVGTEEWQKATEQLNQQVEELVEKYKVLSV